MKLEIKVVRQTPIKILKIGTIMILGTNQMVDETLKKVAMLSFVSIHFGQ